MGVFADHRGFEIDRPEELVSCRPLRLPPANTAARTAHSNHRCAAAAREPVRILPPGTALSKPKRRKWQKRLQ